MAHAIVEPPVLPFQALEIEDYLAPFKPPTRHERQMPKVLPLRTMLVQRFLIEASSCKLSVPRWNGVSVAAGGKPVIPDQRG